MIEDVLYVFIKPLGLQNHSISIDHRLYHRGKKATDPNFFEKLILNTLRNIKSKNGGHAIFFPTFLSIEINLTAMG